MRRLPRAPALACLLLWEGAALGVASASVPEGSPRFQAWRHPDTAAAGPYRVTVEQVRGEAVTGGEVRYRAVCSGREAAAATALHSLGAGRWEGEIPDQLPGCEVRYHFALDGTAGDGTLHPRRAPETGYRFRVLPLAVLAVHAEARPEPVDDGTAVRLTVAARARPRASLRLRLAPELDFDRRVELEVRSAGAGRFELGARLPAPHRGLVADWYLEATVSGGGGPGGPVRFPADAPSRFFSYKVPALRLHALHAGGAAVSAVAGLAGKAFVGLDGGGLLEANEGDEGASGGGPIRRTFADGLASGRVAALAADGAAGMLYVASHHGGVQALMGEGLPIPVASRLFAAAPGLGDLPRLPEVDLLTVSPFDGSVLFQQVSGDRHQPGEIPRMGRAWIQRDGRLAPLGLEGADGGGVITAAAVDRDGGCLLLAWSQPVASPLGVGSDSRLVLERRCGEGATRVPLGAVPVAGGWADPYGADALAMDVATGELLLAVQHPSPAGGAATETTIYRRRDEVLEPLHPDLSRLGVRVSALATDPSGRRLLVATRGEGLRVLEDGGVTSLGAGRGLPSDEVTSLAFGVGFGEGASASWLIGTAAGPASWRQGKIEPLWRDTFDAGPHPALRLADRDAASGAWLAQEGDGGLAVLRIAAGGEIEIEKRLRAGVELPPGAYGAAIFGAGTSSDPESGDETSEIFAVRRAGGDAVPGLVQIPATGKPRLLTAADGLRGNPIELLVRAPGSRDLWLGVAATPFTGTPGLQLYDPVARREAAFIELRTSFGEAVHGDGGLFAPTGFGIYRLGSVGEAERISDRSFGEPLAVDGGLLVATHGSPLTLATKDEKGRFRPLRYGVSGHPRGGQGIPLPEGVGQSGLVIAPATGRWHRLTGGGLHTLLPFPSKACPGGALCEPPTAEVRDVEDGLPPTAYRLHRDPATGLLLVSTFEGLAVLEVLAFGRKSD